MISKNILLTQTVSVCIESSGVQLPQSTSLRLAQASSTRLRSSQSVLGGVWLCRFLLGVSATDSLELIWLSWNKSINVNVTVNVRLKLWIRCSPAAGLAEENFET